MANGLPGFFLTVEGGEGAGKSTAVDSIAAWLDARGIEYVKTREPGGTHLSEAIRDLLLHRHGESLSEMSELLLMFAARAENLAQTILPALSQGKVVVCDRFTDATYAYQGGGRQLETDSIAVLERLVQQQCQPDLTLLLDVDPAVGRSRVELRSQPLDRIEREGVEFFVRVREAYIVRAEACPQRFEVIDAGAPLGTVQAQLTEVLHRRLSDRYPSTSGA